MSLPKCGEVHMLRYLLVLVFSTGYLLPAQSVDSFDEKKSENLSAEYSLQSQMESAANTKREPESKRRKTVCLNMIVKNETRVIRRCLESVKPIIDYWVIVDTGSTDGTQEMIKEFMKDVPGELHERPWVDFAHNRNQALDFAKNKADYVLIIDADEVLERDSNFALPELDKDFYYITTKYGGTRYVRVQLVNNHLDWRWGGVVHEAIDCLQAKTMDTLQGIANVVFTDGFRSTDPQKYHKDALVLEAALAKEPNNTRNQFYLAQSYRDAQEYELALKHYKKRFEMGGWDEERFWSLMQIALIQEWLEMDSATVIEGYKKAFAFRPTRVEPLYHLCNYYRQKVGNCRESYKVAREGLAIQMPKDVLFIDSWIYDYGLLLEYSIACYWTEKYVEAQVASLLILSKPDIPSNFRECVERNLRCIHAKLEETKLAALP